MASKRVPPSIGIEDASQLSILAYQVKSKRVVDVERFIERLQGEYARRVAEAIAAHKDSPTSSVGDDTLRTAAYYLEWAEQTANARADRTVSGRKGTSPED
jgi:hypothetical protein